MTPWKVYRDREHVASLRYSEDAAMLASMCPGSVVKWDHRTVVWREGSEEFSAADSYDGASEIMIRRRDKAYAASRGL
jgi:hypothetical protein